MEVKVAKIPVSTSSIYTGLDAKVKCAKENYLQQLPGRIFKYYFTDKLIRFLLPYSKTITYTMLTPLSRYPNPKMEGLQFRIH